MAPQSNAFTYDDQGPLKKIIMDWDSSTIGVVNADNTTKKIVGTLLKGVTDPSTTAPTDKYDITITDEEGFDVLTNSIDDLVDRDTANIEEVYFNVYTTDSGAFPVVCDKLTIAIAGAGDTKAGRLIVYYRSA